MDRSKVTVEHKSLEIVLEKFHLNSDSLGQYNLKSNSLVDIVKNNKEDIKYTEIHEYVHYSITLRTAYGIFTYLLENIKAIDNKMEWYLDILCRRMKIIQESAATYIQLMSMHLLEGEAKLQSTLAKMKIINETYYNYYNTFSFLNLLIKTPKDVLRIIDFVNQLCNKILDIDLTKMDLANVIDRRRFKKLQDTHDYLCEFSPDKRLKLALKELEEVIKQDSSFNLEKYNIKAISGHEIAINENYLYKLREYISCLFEGSRRKDSIVQKLNKYSLTNRIPGLLSVYPTIINAVELIPTLQIKLIDEDERASVFDNNNNIGIFILAFSNFFIKNHIPIFYFGLKPFTKKATYFTHEEIGPLLADNKKPVVVIGDRQLFIKRIEEIKELNSNNTFVLLETAIINNIKYINEIMKDGYYRVFNYPKFSVLVIKKRNIRFIQLISINAFDELLYEIDNGIIELKSVEIDENDYDNYVIKNRQEKFNLDLVINAIFIQLEEQLEAYP